MCEAVKAHTERKMMNSKEEMRMKRLEKWIQKMVRKCYLIIYKYYENRRALRRIRWNHVFDSQ